MAPVPKEGFFKSIILIPKNLIDDFWGTLGDLQDQRLLWFLGGLSGLFFEVFSYLYFQKYLSLRPCEYCVLIRFCMLVIFLGGMIGTILPSSLIFKIPGLIVSMTGAVMGLRYTILLEIINIEASLPGFLPLCSSGRVDFPLNIPMEKYLPEHFIATGTCGEDTLWSLWDFNMSEWLIMIYVVYILGLFLMFIAHILKTLKAGKLQNQMP
jgi:disulfide bond formation protein DsbB